MIKDDNQLLVVSVATKENDGYRRYIRSLKQYGIKHEVTIFPMIVIIDL